MEPQEKVDSRDSPEEKSPRLDDLGGSVSLTTTETENSLENEEVTDSKTAIDTVQSATPASKPVEDLQVWPLTHFSPFFVLCRKSLNCQRASR